MPIKVKKGLASDKVLGELKKQHGEQIGARGGKYPPVARIPFGIFPLDLATGGGIPRSRVSIMTGRESSGKSLNLYKAMLTVQRMGETAVLVDAEHAWDADWGKQIGLDLSKLIIVQPDNAEQAVDAVEAFLYARDVGLVGIDSVSAFTTEKEIQAGADVQYPGGAAAMVTKMIRKVGIAFTKEAKQNHLPALVVISQIRMLIGKLVGNPETMSGGNALRFASSLTLRLYGQNKMVEAVNENKPTFKTVKGSIQKARIPIIGNSFEYDQCILAHDGLGIGDVEAWNTVAAFLKSQGQLVKSAKTAHWVLFEKSYSTLEQIHTRYKADPDFALQCQQAVFAQAVVIDAKPVSKPKHTDTGEILE